jgi:murein tripeptide amidase MpaA
MIAVLVLAAILHTNFEAGSLGKIERVSPTHFRCSVKGEVDQDSRNRQASWYYFRLDHAAGREITIDLVDLAGEYDYRAGAFSITKASRPVYSDDDKTWKHFRDQEVQWDDRAMTLRLRFTPLKNRMWIAHVPPYTTADLARLLRTLRGNPYLQEAVIGKTVSGGDMLLLTVTNPATPETNKKVVWLMARQHAWEAGTSWVAEGAIRFLLSPDPGAARIRDELIFKIFPMTDPDGVARGGVRFNAHGYDLNRNWDAVNPRLMPEIAAHRKAVLDWVDAGRRIDLFLTLHNTEDTEFLEGPLAAGGAQVQKLAERFSRLLTETTSFNPTRPPDDSSPKFAPVKPGRMTVDQGLFHDRRIPAFLMEQMVDSNSKLGHPPTVEDRLEFGAGLARAMCAAVRRR